MTPWIIFASQTTITFDEQSVLAMVIMSSSGASFMSREIRFTRTRSASLYYVAFTANNYSCLFLNWFLINISSLASPLYMFLHPLILWNHVTQALNISDGPYMQEIYTIYFYSAFPFSHPLPAPCLNALNLLVAETRAFRGICANLVPSSTKEAFK